MSRVTYLIDKTGVIRDVYHHEVRIGKHVDDVLEGLKALGQGGGRRRIHAYRARHRRTFRHLRPAYPENDGWQERGLV